MFRTVDGQNYWVNDAEERGKEFMTRGSIRSTAFLIAALAGGIVMLMASNLLPATLWWAMVAISVGCAMVTLPVARLIAQRFSKLGKFEREGVIANTSGRAFGTLARRLEDFDIDLMQVTKDRDRGVVWPLVSVYLRRVYRGVVAMEKDGIADESFTELQRSMEACASEMAEYLSEVLEKLWDGDKLLDRYDRQVDTLRTRLMDAPMSDERQGAILTEVEKGFG